MSSAWSHAAGDLIAGKYRVTGQLGRGGMGSVYEAVHQAIGKTVAVKVLDASLAERPDFARRFELEALAASRVNHPGVVDVLDFGREPDGSAFIVMEHLLGLTVRSALELFGPFSAPLAVAVVAPALDALAAAHAAGVIHRDLKPGNLFLVSRPAPAVKVLDFGIARFAGPSAGLTNTGTSLGTPAFMAPEQLQDGRAASAASDLYSVGAVLYTLVTGHPPFVDESDFALVGKVLTTDPVPLKTARPELPEAFCTLVDRLLSKDVAARPATARELKALLVTAAPPATEQLFSLAGRFTPTEVPAAFRRETATPAAAEAATVAEGPRALAATPRPEAPRRRGRWTWGLLLVPGLATVAGWVALRPAPDPRPPSTGADATPSAGLLALAAGEPGVPFEFAADGGPAPKLSASMQRMQSARVLREGGDDAGAFAMLEEDLAAARAGRDVQALVMAMRNHANLEQDEGRCDAAREQFLRAIALLEPTGDQQLLALLANDLGMLGHECGVVDPRPWFKVALELRWNNRDLQASRKSANNLATAYTVFGDFEQADQAYNEALISATLLNDRAAIVRIRGNQGYMWAVASAKVAEAGERVFDMGSPEWAKSREAVLAGMGVAGDAGIDPAVVCNYWGHPRNVERCQLLLSR